MLDELAARSTPSECSRLAQRYIDARRASPCVPLSIAKLLAAETAGATQSELDCMLREHEGDGFQTLRVRGLLAAERTQRLCLDFKRQKLGWRPGPDHILDGLAHIDCLHDRRWLAHIRKPASARAAQYPKTYTAIRKMQSWQRKLGKGLTPEVVALYVDALVRAHETVGTDMEESGLRADQFAGALLYVLPLTPAELEQIAKRPKGKPGSVPLVAAFLREPKGGVMRAIECVAGVFDCTSDHIRKLRLHHRR